MTPTMTAGTTRRRFLAGGGAAALAWELSMAPPAAAAEWTAAEKANVQLVRDVCLAWESLDVDTIAAFFSDTCALRWNERTPFVTGRQAVRETIAGVVTGATRVELKLVDVYPKGPLVFNERLDLTVKPARRSEPFRVGGIILVKDGKIAEWNDYALR